MCAVHAPVNLPFTLNTKLTRLLYPACQATSYPKAWGPCLNTPTDRIVIVIDSTQDVEIYSQEVLCSGDKLCSSSGLMSGWESPQCCTSQLLLPHLQCMRKLCLLYAAAFIPASWRALCIWITSTNWVRGMPDASLKRGLGVDPRTARYCQRALTGHIVAPT